MCAVNVMHIYFKYFTLLFPLFSGYFVFIHLYVCVVISEGQIQVFMVMKFQVVVLWVLTPYSDVVGYQHFRWPCSLHLHPEGGPQFEGTEQ